jgi:hypothetical protein
MSLRNGTDDVSILKKKFCAGHCGQKAKIMKIYYRSCFGGLDRGYLVQQLPPYLKALATTSATFKAQTNELGKLHS